MPLRSRFAIIEFFEQIGTEAGRIEAPWAEFTGSSSSLQSFTVDGEPVFVPPAGGEAQNAAWIVTQAWGVATSGTRVEVNGEGLGGLVLPPAAGWQSWLTVFTQPPRLQPGVNTIQFFADPEALSNTILASVVLCWQELVLAGGATAPDAQPAGRRPSRAGARR